MDRRNGAFGKEAGKYAPTDADRRRYPNAILVRADFRRCARKRNAVLAPTERMRTAIDKYYDLHAGNSRGITVGVIFGKSIVWIEIPLCEYTGQSQ